MHLLPIIVGFKHLKDAGRADPHRHNLTHCCALIAMFGVPFFFFYRFPNNLLFTSASGELWKMVRIGGQPLGFGK